jgi:hypothetical protein
MSWQGLVIVMKNNKTELCRIGHRFMDCPYDYFARNIAVACVNFCEHAGYDKDWYGMGPLAVAIAGFLFESDFPDDTWVLRAREADSNAEVEVYVYPPAKGSEYPRLEVRGSELDYSGSAPDIIKEFDRQREKTREKSQDQLELGI